MHPEYSAWLDVARGHRSSGAASGLILKSWRRSDAAGLRREDPPTFHRISDQELRERQQHRRALIEAAIPHLEWLIAWFHGRPTVAYVADQDGIVLHAAGAPEILEMFHLAPGHDWSEARMGTNGAGTAIAARSPVAVVGCDHWSHAWSNATCLGAPIIDSSGHVVGAIDVSTDLQPGDAERLVVAAHVAYTISSEIARREAEERAAAIELQRAATYEALQDAQVSRNLLQTIIDSLAAPVYVVDREHRFQLINREFGRLFGMDPREAAGRSVYECFPRETADQFVAHNEQVCREERPLDFEEVVPVDGRPRTYLTNKAPLRSAAGSPFAICGVATDVTERTELTAALDRAIRQKDVFLATVAHELRQPLGAVQAALGVIGLGAGRDSAERARRTAERQVAQLGRLVEDLVDASRIVRGHVTIDPRPTRLRDVIELAVNVVEADVAERAQRLEVTLPDTPVWVNGDALRLQQVFSNLLTNAVKFTPEHGRIGLAVQRTGDTVTVRVHDSGRGISAEALPHVFELFAQEKPESGLGIGLSVVRALVEQHGGSVEVRSEGQDLGSEFLVRLPALTPDFDLP